MNTKNWLIVIVLAVAISALSYWAGSCGTSHDACSNRADNVSEDEAFQRGLKVGRGKQAWLQASEARLSLLLLAREEDKYDRLREQAVDNMWYATLPLYDFINNEHADAKDRAAASGIMAEIVALFRKQPRRIEKPEETKLVEGYNKASSDGISKEGMTPQEEKVYSHINEKIQEPLGDLESLFDGILSDLYARDVATQAVIDHLIKERHLPGKKLQWAGFTLWMPKTRRGSGSSSGDEFDYSGTGFEVSYREGMLTMNGVEYGELSKGDIVDFRDTGVVVVNGIKRSPKAKK